jgi:hypothetical protein
MQLQPSMIRVVADAESNRAGRKENYLRNRTQVLQTSAHEQSVAHKRHAHNRRCHTPLMELLAARINTSHTTPTSTQGNRKEAGHQCG